MDYLKQIVALAQEQLRQLSKQESNPIKRLALQALQDRWRAELRQFEQNSGTQHTAKKR